MRSREEIQNLLVDIEEAVEGGIRSGALHDKLGTAQIMASLLRWVLGEDNRVCDLVRRMDAVSLRHVAPGGTKWPN